MQLTNNHRAELVRQLENHLAYRETLRTRLQSETAKNDLTFAEATEIEDWLNTQRIADIKQALTDVEIDY